MVGMFWSPNPNPLGYVSSVPPQKRPRPVIRDVERPAPAEHAQPQVRCCEPRETARAIPTPIRAVDVRVVDDDGDAFFQVKRGKNLCKGDVGSDGQTPGPVVRVKHLVRSSWHALHIHPHLGGCEPHTRPGVQDCVTY